MTVASAAISFNHDLRKIRTVKSLPQVTPHQLRHMAATILGEENFEVDTIGAALGQKGRRSSERYVDKTQKMRTIALSRVAKVLANSQIIRKYGSGSGKSRESGGSFADENDSQNKYHVCPQRDHKFLYLKE